MPTGSIRRLSGLTGWEVIRTFIWTPLITRTDYINLLEHLVGIGLSQRRSIQWDVRSNIFWLKDGRSYQIVIDEEEEHNWMKEGF